jgi:glycerol dehydrogenase
MGTHLILSGAIMSTHEPFFPEFIFAGLSTDLTTPPRVFISPHRYIQGKDAMDRLGRYIAILPSRRPMVLITEGGNRRFGQRIMESFWGTDVEARVEIFGGECSTEEVERIVNVIQKAGHPVDSVIAVGGGKCIDTGKCVAFNLDMPVVICPTVASTDAPCSAVSVMYTPDGVGKGPVFFPKSPALVVVDTGIIAASPLRYLVAGMGDALATCYEARTCYRNPSARSMVGARITIAALALAELCAKTVFEDGIRAVASIERGESDLSVERIVEANTLLSGVGFESGGLAAAHAMAAGLTVIPVLHREYLHGELVSIGLVSHLILENEADEAKRVARLLTELGLPVRLKQLQLDIHTDAKALLEAMKASMNVPFASNEPFKITPEKLFSALREADRLGTEIVAEIGEIPFRKLRHQ